MCAGFHNYGTYLHIRGIFYWGLFEIDGGAVEMLNVIKHCGLRMVSFSGDEHRFRKKDGSLSAKLAGKGQPSG
jgi:hypothetical protein